MANPRFHDPLWEEKIINKERSSLVRFNLLIKAPGLAEINTVQGYDTSAYHPIIDNAEYANEEDVPRMTTESLSELSVSGETLPARAMILKHLLNPSAPATMDDLFARAQAAFGHLGPYAAPRFHVINKNTALYDAHNAHVNLDINELAQHFRNPGSDNRLLDLQQMSADFIPGSSNWIPGFVREGNVLAAANGPESAWLSVADETTYCLPRFDSHGLGTFFTPLVGEILLIFNNQVDDPKVRIDIMRWEQNERTDISMQELKQIYKNHMRYVIVEEGMLWYMEPGTIYTMYRNEGTVLFGGHFLPQQKIGLWIHTIAESLKYPFITKEKPDAILVYLDVVLSALEAQRPTGDWKLYGGAAAVHSFLQETMEVLTEGIEWYIESPGAPTDVDDNLRDRWHAGARRIATAYADLLYAEKSDL